MTTSAGSSGRRGDEVGVAVSAAVSAMTERPPGHRSLRLGVLDSHPIQYHSPVYRAIARRGVVDIDVMYLSDRGSRPALDPEFGVTFAWDVDLLSGFRHGFLGSGGPDRRGDRRFLALARWLRSHDAVVIHGYSDRRMLSAILLARVLRTPYLLRCDSWPEGTAKGVTRYARNALTRVVVSGCAAGLAVGQLNERFYRRFRAPEVVFAPFAVDDSFGAAPKIGRAELLARWGLPAGNPVILYSGKLYPGKRPLDLAAAAIRLPEDVNVIFVGDGVLADEVRASLKPGSGVVTGFVNQSEMSSYYHAADIIVLPSEIEKFGIVVNEAMAAGALPVVSDRVGAGPDLVRGIGEIYPCGDVDRLAAALLAGLGQIADPAIRERVRATASRYSVSEAAIGFERAALLACERPRRYRRRSMTSLE